MSLHVYRGEPIVMTGTAIINLWDDLGDSRVRGGRSVYLLECPENIQGCSSFLDDLLVRRVGRATCIAGLERIAGREGAAVGSTDGLG